MKIIRPKYSIFALIIFLCVSSCGPGQGMGPTYTSLPTITPVPTSTNTFLSLTATPEPTAMSDLLEKDKWSSSGPEGGFIIPLAIDPVTPTTLYAGTYGNGVFKSTNGGGNWSLVDTGLTNTDVIALAIDPVTPTTLYAATYGNGVFKSTNGGGNWSAVNTGHINLDVSSMAMYQAAP